MLLPKKVVRQTNDLEIAIKSQQKRSGKKEAIEEALTELGL